MDKIAFREASKNEYLNISEQIAVSYKAAYKGHMSDSYLSSLTSDYWVPILKKSADKGDTCLISVRFPQIIGSAVFGNSDLNII